MKIRKFNESDSLMTWEEYKSRIDSYIEHLKDNLASLSDDNEIDIDQVNPDLRSRYNQFKFDINITIQIDPVRSKFRGIEELENYSKSLNKNSEIINSIFEGINRAYEPVLDLSCEIYSGSVSDNFDGEIKILIKIIDNTDHLFKYIDE